MLHFLFLKYFSKKNTKMSAIFIRRNQKMGGYYYWRKTENTSSCFSSLASLSLSLRPNGSSSLPIVLQFCARNLNFEGVPTDSEPYQRLRAIRFGFEIFRSFRELWMLIHGALVSHRQRSDIKRLFNPDLVGSIFSFSVISA